MNYGATRQALTPFDAGVIDRSCQEQRNPIAVRSDKSQQSTVEQRPRSKERLYKRMLHAGLSMMAIGVGMYLLYDEFGFFTKFEYGVELCVIGGPFLAFAGEILAVFGGYRRWTRNRTSES